MKKSEIAVALAGAAVLILVLILIWNGEEKDPAPSDGNETWFEFHTEDDRQDLQGLYDLINGLFE